MTKLSFAIENAEVVSENPNSSFAVLSIDFFADGKSLNNTYVSEETLLRTAPSIKNCPVTWVYDEILDDIGTHGKEETACGFIPEKAEIKTRKLPDGRTMLSTIAYVWKRYTGEFLNIFKRDNGTKPVSVEMSVFNMRELPGGLKELLDYRFEAITVLGSFVSPAIPMARADVMSFSKEYEEAVRKEFSNDLYAEIDFTIPSEVKKKAKKALETHKIQGGASSVVLSVARHLNSSSHISPDKAKYINKFIKSKKSQDELTFNLLGGKESVSWSAAICEQMESIDKRTFRYFEEEEKSTEKMEINMSDKEEGKVEEVLEPVATEELVTMAETPTEEKKEDPAEEKTETPEEEKKEEKKFAFPAKFDVEKMCGMFAEDPEDEDVKMAAEELKKGKEFAAPDVVMAGMFARMCKMADVMCKMAEDSKVYMAENEELKKFKAEYEAKEKQFAVDLTLKELAEKVVIPDEARDEMVAEADKYAFENIDAWKTFCKAKSFDFAVKAQPGDEKSKIVRVGLPFGETTKKPKDLWAQ